MDSVRIGCNYENQRRWKVHFAVPLIYLQIFTTIPFVAIGVLLIREHLKHVGGMEI